MPNIEIIIAQFTELHNLRISEFTVLIPFNKSEWPHKRKIILGNDGIIIKRSNNNECKIRFDVLIQVPWGWAGFDVYETCANH